MTFKIITADERLASPRGVKALILGPPGVGKTSLLRTVDPKRTLFVDLEAGDLAVQDVAVDTMRPKTWQECRDLAAFLGGPNPALSPDSPYSVAHYDFVTKEFGGDGLLDRYDTYFIDSITVSSRFCFTWAQQQPDAFTDKGKSDVRGAYGLLAREMIGWISQLQHARNKNVVFVGILEMVYDDFKRGSWQAQIEGSKTGRELPGIVDQVISYQFIRREEQDTLSHDCMDRMLVCRQPNQWDLPAKDRSGRLDLLEEPDLGALIAKVTNQATQRS
jgi:hypothetical protein